MATVIKINGSAVNCPRPVRPRRLVPHVKGGVPTASFSVRGGKLPAVAADPYLGKTYEVIINGTTYFKGRVAQRETAYAGGVGWNRTYQCLGTRDQGDLVPHIDGNDGFDSSTYNAEADNQSSSYLAARAGRTVGQILTSALTGTANAQALDSYGLGGYTGLPSAPVLPAATVADLAALSTIPSGPAGFGGERLLSAVESFCQTHAPNVVFWVDPSTGYFRFTDLDSYANHTFTLNSDPCHVEGMTRDTSGCFGRVVLKGPDVAEMGLFSLSQGTLDETPFAYGGGTVAAAKAAFLPTDWFVPTGPPGYASQDKGTCTCPSTLTVTLTSAFATAFWSAGYWDNAAGNRHGTILLRYTAGAGISLFASRRVVACPAKAAGATCTLTLDRALPHTNFDAYTLSGDAAGPANVYTLYRVSDTVLRTRLAAQSTYPFAYHFGGGSGLNTTSAPTGIVVSGAQELMGGVVVDRSAGTIRFAYPTKLQAGGEPTDVRALLPVYVASNRVVYPPDVAGVPQYAGTVYTVEGLTDTRTITVPSWRDPANLTAMTAAVYDQWRAVAQTSVSGVLVYQGLYEPALKPGLAVSITGSSYVTGWDSLALANVETQLEWDSDGLTYKTMMKCSNRRQPFAADAFLRPDRTGLDWDWQDRGGLEHFADGVRSQNPSQRVGVPDLPPTPAPAQSAAGTTTGKAAGGDPAALNRPFDGYGGVKNGL